MALVTTDAAALVEGTARFASAARRPTQTPPPTGLSGPLGELSLGHTLASVLAVVRRHQLHLLPSSHCSPSRSRCVTGWRCTLTRSSAWRKRSLRMWPSSSRRRRRIR